VVTPWGNFIGAVIMFWVLGFIPGWIAAKVLQAFGVLRIPREVEIAGLDIVADLDSEQESKEVSASVRQAAKSAGLVG